MKELERELHRKDKALQDALVLRLAVLFGEFDRAAEEFEAAEHRLAALPGDVHLRSRARLHQLPDIRLQQGVRHQWTFARRIQVLFREKEAVLAAEIAGGARRLDEEVVWRGLSGCHGIPTRQGERRG